uniref:Uncharacterized protein n=1 Tax=Timema monikensis TaxID=170555 RepID=A0A7R9HWN5_9NEOP|nr:unnamed protein product [Timema monikensis]
MLTLVHSKVETCTSPKMDIKAIALLTGFLLALLYEVECYSFKHGIPLSEEKYFPDDSTSVEERHNVNHRRNSPKKENAVSQRAIFDLILGILNTFKVSSENRVKRAKEKEGYFIN